MDCTQLRQFRSYDPGLVKDTSYLASSTHAFNRNDDQEEFFKIIKNLDQINNARSLPNNLLNIIPSSDSQQLTMSRSEEMSLEQDKKTEKSEESKEHRLSGFHFKSLLKVENHIKIFLQNSNQFVVYRFERDTLVKQVVGAVLLIFATEPANKYFKNHILNPQQYSLKMNSLEGKDLQPYSKIRMYNLNDVFLASKMRMKSQVYSHQELQNPKFEIVITLYNQQYIEILKITLGIEEKLEKIYKKFQRNRNFSTNKYLLTENLQTEIELSKSLLVKQLTFPIIYIKARKFADETEHDRVKPFTLIINNQAQINSLNPISITEASMYEEFEVVKVNKFGKQQERILGVDQMKIYNYQKRVRIYNKDVSLLGMIRGLDKVAGTKNPFMKIEDLLSLKQDPNQCKLTLKFRDKQQVYYLKSTVTLAKLSRKLLFLVSYHAGCV